MTLLSHPSRITWWQRMFALLAMACVVFTSLESGIFLDQHEVHCPSASQNYDSVEAHWEALGFHSGDSHRNLSERSPDTPGQHVYVDHCMHSHAMFFPKLVSLHQVTTLVDSRQVELGEAFYDSVIVSPQQRPPIA